MSDNTDDLKELAKVFAFLQCFVGGMVSAIMTIGGNNDYTDYKLAESPQEYFAYLETQDIGTKQSNTAYQMAFMAMGYDIGKCGADGFFEYASMKAAGSFQQDYNLPYTMQLDLETRQKITEVIETSEELQIALDEMLLDPFEAPVMQDFIDGMDFQTSAFNRYGTAFLRPDALISGMSGLFLGYANGYGMEKAFPEGCANWSKVDALRHSEAAVKIADFWLVPSFSAEAAVNVREYTRDNPMPVMLTDMANHKIAMSRFHEVAGYDTEDIVKDIKAGVYILQPLPIIEEDFEYTPEISVPEV